MKRLGLDMLDYMWDRGWDREHGGILYFTDLYGSPSRSTGIS
jgi:N-acylglucosamine 2-epimerase